MSTLEALCYETIARSIKQSPPLIQEMVMGETKNKIADEIEKKIENSYKKTNDIISSLVPEILVDIIETMTNNNKIRKDFRSIYSHFPKSAVECAILTAENCSNNFNNNMHFEDLHNNNNNNMDQDYEDNYEDNYEEDSEEDYIDYIDYPDSEDDFF